MSGKRADRQTLRTLIQQRQEQQRDRATSTPETGGSVAREQRQGVTVQFNPHATDQVPVFSDFAPAREMITLTAAGFSRPAPWPGQPLSPTYTPPVKPAPTIPEVGRRIEQELAHLPQVPVNSQGPLSAAQEAALDLLDALAGELARHLSPQVLADRLPALGTAAGQAVRNAIREAGQ